jgi:hypothetical protein
MPLPSSSHSSLPELDELIVSFNKLYISMPSRDSSTENLVDRILDQPWRSPLNPAMGEPMPYDTTSSTPSQSSPSAEQEVPALSPPPPSRPVTPIVHRSPPPSSSDNASSDEDDNDMPLGEGWFRSQPGVHRTRLTIPPHHGAPEDELVDAKYLRFTINFDGEPMIEATMGQGGPHYALPIMASPVEGQRTPPANDEEDLAFLAETHMMNSALNRALEGLGDYGVYADVIQLRAGR